MLAYEVQHFNMPPTGTGLSLGLGASGTLTGSPAPHLGHLGPTFYGRWEYIR